MEAQLPLVVGQMPGKHERMGARERGGIEFLPQ